MGKIWFRSRQKRNLTSHFEKILKKWQLSLRDYQRRTGDIGYYYTEKTNFGFFLWGCAQLKIPFLLEWPMERKYWGGDKFPGRADGFIWIDDIEIIFEVKMIYDRPDTTPRPKIFEIADILGKELKSIKWRSKKVKRIGLCFVVLERNRGKIDKKSTQKVLSEYLEQLKDYPSIDFFAAYQSPKRIVNDPENIYDKRYICPAVIVIGKYV